MLNEFLFDSRGYDVVRSVIEPTRLDAANAAIDALDAWRCLIGRDEAPCGRWTHSLDEVVRYVCEIGDGHIQVGPVVGFPNALSDLLHHPTLVAILAQMFPHGFYLDHASLSLAREGSPGIELHGGGHEQDPRQGYRVHRGVWDMGLSILVISLGESPAPRGGTALVPGSHKADFMPSGPVPQPADFPSSDWVTGPNLHPGDVLAFPEALMHGAFPWTCPWERRALIIKAYPAHIRNLNGCVRAATEPFWS